MSLIEALPKADLHCHLDGSLRLRTIWDLAREQGIDLGVASVEGLAEKIRPRPGEDLRDYIAKFVYPLAVLQEADALRRVARELAEDAHEENVRYLEVRFAPDLHTRKGMTLSEVVEAVLAGLNDAERSFGIESRVIVCAIRTVDPDASLRLAELAVSFKNRGVVGFDLAGEERDNPAKHHLKAFYEILNHNINVTVHAGEAFGAPSISQALHYCGAHRIGHGTHLREDPDLLQYVNDHRIPLEMCLTSNVQTGAARSAAEHPFADYFRLDLRVTLNTDNRLISDTTVTKELALAIETFALSIYDLRKILINGFKSSFLPQAEKKRILRAAIHEMDSLFAGAYPGEYDRYRTFL
ncbi:MAG: adenosine deaminase [Candidatus Eisenbacteria bacterium]|nr:adenosine deaminase [Candidatus Latescibacterota bacterium]MBD3301863.1 adenosine deaminase [Candidatus Eisenbacteria bacterium]